MVKTLIRRIAHGKKYGYRALFCEQDARAAGKPGVILGEIADPRSAPDLLQ